LLVVAGAGLIGSRLADLARDSGWRIRILHRSAAGQAPREGIEVDDSGREPAWDAMSSLLSTLDGDNGNLARVLAPKTSAGPAAAPSSHFGPKSQD